jgi:(p)ppGpp synthase/HD superfamily hydrolase
VRGKAPEMRPASEELVARADTLAERAQAGQTDKAGEHYIEHPRRVASKLDSPSAKVVALLHDVLEDTGVTKAELRGEFGDEVAEAVDALTRRKDVPREEYYARIRGNELALQVKLADIEDNLDPARLARLDAATRERLEAKYAEALRQLSEE